MNRDLVLKARALADTLEAGINEAQTREDYVRRVILAKEAAELADALEREVQKTTVLQTGFTPTHP